MGREELMAGCQEDPASCGGVAALDVKGNFLFDAATHADFLGATLGTGESWLTPVGHSVSLRQARSATCTRHC